MPMILRYIDEICVEKDRDILFLDFDYAMFDDEKRLRDELLYIKETLEWLDSINIEYEEMGYFSNSGHLSGYTGMYYLDVPFDENNKQFKLLTEYLEDDNGNMKDPNKNFCTTTLEICKPMWKQYLIESKLEELYDSYVDREISIEDYYEKANNQGLEFEQVKKWHDDAIADGYDIGCNDDYQ